MNMLSIACQSPNVHDEAMQSVLSGTAMIQNDGHRQRYY
jgi:hypothetical protein